MRERDGREMGGNRRWGKRKGRGEGKNPVGGGRKRQNTNNYLCFDAREHRTEIRIQRKN